MARQPSEDGSNDVDTDKIYYIVRVDDELKVWENKFHSFF